MRPPNAARGLDMRGPPVAVPVPRRATDGYTHAAMPTAPEHVDALVLRAIKYADSDTIVHLFTRTHGRINAIASRARSASSRIGTRIEPFGHLELELRRGRGDLLRIVGAKDIERYPTLRGGYELQHTAASAFDLLAKLAIDGEPCDNAYYLAANLLLLLDGDAFAQAAASVGAQHAASALLAAFQLKLLLAMGLAPQLGACGRCGSTTELGHWSAADGSVICMSCRRFDDAPLDPDVRAAAVVLFERSLRQTLTDIASVGERHATAISREIVTPLCAEHAGVRVRSSSFSRQIGRVVDPAS